jgi:hypothetical protein
MWREHAWDASRRYCVITFDDGWLDNYVHAFPVLRRHNVPATIFLPTGMVGTAKWFWPERIGWLGQRFTESSLQRRSEVLASLEGGDSWLNGMCHDLRAARMDALIERGKTASHERIEELIARLADALEVRLPVERMVMNWDEVRDMAAANISFGSHSVNHKILTDVSEAELQEEVGGSLDTLRSRGLKGEIAFCYPNGNYSAEAMRMVESAGYSAATTTEPGWEYQKPAHLFRLKRIAVHNDLTSSDSLFAFHLEGFNNAP